MEVMTNIPFELKLESLISRLHISEEGEDYTHIKELYERAVKAANLKAVYDISYINSKGDETVDIEGVTFKSKILRINLDKVERVFPFVATCGTELEEIGDSIEDDLIKYYFNTIKVMAVSEAGKYVREYVANKYKLSKTAVMNPGSLEDWPISEQPKLFSLFSDVRKSIGVEITESFLMLPVQSVSGIIYATDVTYENCQLCPRENCPGRRAPYSKELKKKYFRQQII